MREQQYLAAMTTTALKKELHKAIDSIDDATFLQAVYTIVNEKKLQFDLSADEWKEIELAQKHHKAGKSKSYNWDEVKNYAKGHSKK
ncbi:MAG TPA: hypothetical protein VGO45_04770 [Bacteroidia bacterium]|nr:hypothetical protein [Bacteroidia bacterium]